MSTVSFLGSASDCDSWFGDSILMVVVELVGSGAGFWDACGAAGVWSCARPRTTSVDLKIQ